MLNFYIKPGMIIDEIHEIISFKQSKWLEKFISVNTQKRNRAMNDFEQDSYKVLNNPFYPNTMQNVRSRIKIEVIRKHVNERIFKQQSKLIFNGIHKSYTNYDSYTFKQKVVLLEKPLYQGSNIE